MASWGDINAVLNRLVREGVISGFSTNLSRRGEPVPLHVVAQVPVPSDGQGGEVDAGAIEAIRSRILGELKPYDEAPTVTIEGLAAS